MAQLVTPDIKEGFFTANGKKYYLENKISIARKIYSDRLIVEVMSGASPSMMFNDLSKLYNLCNEKKFADIAVSLHNKMHGLKEWNERRDPILGLCALYLNTEEENRREISEELIKQKIADWEAEGIEYGFFSLMAKSLLKELIAIWKENSPNTSEEEEKKEANEAVVQ